MKKIITCIFFIISFQTLTLLHPNFVLAQTEFGYNFHSLTKESPETITNILNQVASKCGANIIRLWGYQSTMGIDGINNLDKVLNAAGANIKFIVCLEDFPYGPAFSVPASWFSSGYQSVYRQY